MCLDQLWQMTQDNGFLHVFSDRPLAFDTISEGMNPSFNGAIDGSVSGDGIAFWADHEPRMNSIISVPVEEYVLSNCSEIERDFLEVDGRIVGKVSSIERNDLANEIVVKLTFLRRNSRYVPESRQALAAARH